MKNSVTNPLFPFAPCCFQHFITTTGTSAPDHVFSSWKSGIRQFARPFHTDNYGKKIKYTNRFSCSGFKPGSKSCRLNAANPTASYQLNIAVIIVQRRHPALLIGFVHLAQSGWVVFDTSPDGSLSFNSCYYTALRRSAHSRERFAPLNRLAGLTDSIPADRPFSDAM